MVAKRFTQVEEIDYNENFSLVIKFQSIGIIVAIVAYRTLELHQMNVKNACHETIEGFVVHNHEDKMYR